MYIDKLPETIIRNGAEFFLIVIKADGMWTVSYCNVIDTDEISMLVEYPPELKFSSKKLRECVDLCLLALGTKKEKKVLGSTANNIDMEPCCTTTK